MAVILAAEGAEVVKGGDREGNEEDSQKFITSSIDC